MPWADEFKPFRQEVFTRLKQGNEGRNMPFTGESYFQQIVPYLEWSIAFLEEEG